MTNARLILLFAGAHALTAWSIRFVPRQMTNRVIAGAITIVAVTVWAAILVAELFAYAAATNHVPLGNDNFFLMAFSVQQIFAVAIMANSNATRKIAQERPISSCRYKGGAYGYYVIFCISCCVVAILFKIPSVQWWPHISIWLSVMFVFLCVLFLRSLALEIRNDGISYTGFLQNTRFLRYSEISAARLVDHTKDSWRPILRQTVVLIPAIESGKENLSIPLTFFPDAASNDLLRLLPPEVTRMT